jgi:hypothetical protein
MGAAASDLYGGGSDIANSYQYASVPTDSAQFTPSTWDSVVRYADRFQEGQGSNYKEAMQNFGNNPETYGYAFQKVSDLSKLGGAPPSTRPADVNINYQQPNDDRYAQLYRRYAR